MMAGRPRKTKEESQMAGEELELNNTGNSQAGDTTEKENTMITMTQAEMDAAIAKAVSEALRETEAKAVSAEESVPPNLRPYMIKAQGGNVYLTVAGRLVWFRGEHPDWDIYTESVKIEWNGQQNDYAIFRCDIYRPVVNELTGALEMIHVSSGTKTETRRDFGDFAEKAEAGAIGRALANLGFGTQFAQELDERLRVVDAPQPSHSRNTGYTSAAPQQQHQPPQQPAGTSEAQKIGEKNAEVLDKARLKAGITDEKWAELCMHFLKVEPSRLAGVPLVMYNKNMIDAMKKVILDNAVVKPLV